MNPAVQVAGRFRSHPTTPPRRARSCAVPVTAVAASTCALGRSDDEVVAAVVRSLQAFHDADW